jgi:hypothetical protein
MLVLILSLIGCVQYDAFDTGGVVDQGSDGCEVILESEGDIKEDGATAAVDFYARVGGEDCNPGGTHVIEMDEWDSGGGISNPNPDSKSVVRTGEIRRYTLACRIDDDTQAGECGCTLAVQGSQDEGTSVSLVID